MGNSPEKIRQTLVDRPTVVIVGGGFGGTTVARNLDEEANVVLIDRKNHLFQNMAALRPCVLPDQAHTVCIPYDKLLTMGAFIQATVESVSDKEVRLVGFDQPISFDYLVIATGSDYTFPMKHQLNTASDIPQMYQLCNDNIVKSENIVIIGGGPVGIELIGELASQYPDKKITLIQSNEKILPGGIPDGLRNSLLTRIKDNFKNVTMVLGERVNITDEMKNALSEAAKNNQAYLTGKRTITTNKENKFECDLVFFCTGIRLNDKVFKDTFKNAINPDTGRLKCKNTMQVEGYENIFTIGDVADIGPQMAAATTNRGGAAPVVSNNIIQHFMKKTNKFKTFSMADNMMIVPLGPNEGAGQLPFGLVGAKITSMLKGGKLLNNWAWPDAGYKEISDKLINQSCKEINANLTDKDIERLAKGVKLEIDVFKKLIYGGASNVNEEDLKSNESDNKDDADNKDNENEAPATGGSDANADANGDAAADTETQMKSAATDENGNANVEPEANTDAANTNADEQADTTGDADANADSNADASGDANADANGDANGDNNNEDANADA